MKYALISAALVFLAQPSFSTTGTGRVASYEALCCIGIGINDAGSTFDVSADGGVRCPAMTQRGIVYALQCDKGMIVRFNTTTDGGRDARQQTVVSRANNQCARGDFSSFDDPIRVDMPPLGQHVSILALADGGTNQCCIYNTGLKPTFATP